MPRRAERVAAYEVRDGRCVLFGRHGEEEVFAPGFFPGLGIAIAELWRVGSSRG